MIRFAAVGRALVDGCIIDKVEGRVGRSGEPVSVGACGHLADAKLGQSNMWLPLSTLQTGHQVDWM